LIEPDNARLPGHEKLGGAWVPPSAKLALSDLLLLETVLKSE